MVIDMRPATMVKKIDRLEREIDLVRHELIGLLGRVPAKRDVFQATAGAWRDVVKGDPVKWQKKIRSEWEHRGKKQRRRISSGKITRA